ncbi:MAG: CARDB domain-containing protein, partial [Thermoplasmata archaeon]|nr:CARDB domain-containing protein [Thermoplasmata archaeon]
MSDNKIRRKIVWEKSGVSEIIGTILMLSITVVLFSSIITFVGSMPAPKQTFVVDLKCSVVPVNGTWDEAEFRILHEGGQVIDGIWVEVYITVDDQIVTRDVDDGLVDANADDRWGVGEWWVIRVGNAEATTLSATSDFTITIVDQEKNMLIWYETIGEGVNNYAPVINRAWIDSDLATPEVDDYGPISYETVFKIYVEIEDSEGIGGALGLNKSDLWVDVSEINSTSPPLQLYDVLDSRDAANDNIYVAYCDGPIGTGPFKVPVGYYFFFFSATDHSNRTSNPFAAMFPVGMIVGEKPQIVVTGDNPVTGKYEGITFSNPEPTNGDTIDITATILNLGGKGANVDVWFYLDFEAPANLINPIPKTILVPEVGQQDAKISWVASPGGLHTIIVNATVRDETAEFYDPDLSDNVNQTEISVMPKILVVDDDSHINDLSDGDTTSYLRASLEAADFKYDFVTVGSGDGPGYDYGDYPLINYDVVIWMTGYRETKTLTDSAIGTMATRTDDVANLRKYLTGSPTGVRVDGLNGGSLWLISEGFWTEALTSPGLNAFASQYLHINPMPLNPPPNSLPAQLYGNETHPVTDYFSDIPINTVEVIPGTGSVHYWSYVDYPGERIALNDSADPKRAYAITYDSDKEPADTIVDSRQLAQTWDFSRIKDTATQAQYTYKAILWLGNITSKFTQDIAISEQTIEPETVFYKQQVTIKFVVRNNGLTNYTIADNLWWLLRIMDMNGNDLILPHLERIYDLGIKSNNTITLSFPWTPQEIGYHRISIKVDPYNYIQESNELNNEISSYWGTGELNVLYRVLVVDDDGSANNGGSCHNETMDLTEALDHLNYDYEIYTVNTTDDGPAFNNVDNLTALNQYNAVIWVVGSAAPPLPAPLTVNDVLNLTQYLDIGGNLWLLGDSLWTAGDETPDAFEMGYLKISSVEGDEGLGTVLLGVEDDDISHGMEYDCNAAPDADAITPTAEGTGFTFMDDTLTQFSSIRFFGLSASTLTYRSAVTSWPLSALGENLSRAEFTFMMLRWFDKPEERIEVRISDIDIWVSDEHPQLGGGYVIQAAVQNTGGSTGNVLVRFMDGTTQIGSDSISVSADGWTTAEIIWVPLFAGERTISIQLDPILEVDEIFPYSTAGWTNNIATRDIYVYFFWDDMESGTGKWSHSSTIMMVNGEGPLEYFGTTAVSVNIEKDWDYALSTNIVNCTDVGFYHTYDKSFWLQEPAGSTTVTVSRPPIDVVFALDTSGSMTATAMTNLRDATQNFIGKLNDQDRAAIFTYDGNWDEDDTGAYDAADAEPYQQRTYQYMDAANRDSFNTTISGFAAAGYTPFYDTVGEAIQYTQDNLLPDRLEYVIAMTDGISNSDDEWTPETTWGMTTTNDPQDYDDDNWRQNSGGLKGIINPPCMVYSIGLGISHDPAYPTAPDWSRTPPAADNIGIDNYEYEYDVWHIADSSPFPLNDAGGKYGENATTLVDNVGHYYYTTDSSQLPTIFEDIFSSIIIGVLEGEEQTRSSPPSPETTAVTTYTFGGVTAAAGPHDAYWNDMDDSTQAELTAPTLRTEATDAQYLLIANSDNTRWASGDPGNFDEVGWEFRYTILQNPSTITSIDLTYEGQWDQAGSVVTCYAWNQATATWDIVGATMTFTLADTDYTMTRTIAVNPANYINGGTLRVVFYGSQSSELSRCDFASCVVTWTQPPYIMSTTPADGAGDVALTDTIVINFSEAINPITFAWNINPDPSPGLWTAVWGGGNTIVTLSHPTPYTQSTMYTVTVLSGQNMAGTSISPYVLTISTGFESGTLEGWNVNGAGTWSFNIASDRAIGTYSVKGGQSGYTYIYRNGLDLSSSVNTQLTFYTQSINTDNGEDNLEVFISTND